MDPMETDDQQLDAQAIWYELAAKYDVPEFGADPLPEPTFDDDPDV